MICQVQNLVRDFGRKRAVDGLSFRVESGHIVGFVGPNGAGKTTTMSIMATLDEPTSGDVLLDGRSVVDYPIEARRRIGFMPDELPAHRDITAHEYVDFFARAYGLRGEALARAVADTEEFTGLGPIRDRTLAALSKGMKQRVSLARAIVHDPDLLILDEPANGLDPRARIELRELVHVLAERGKAILISSHILSELEEMCTDVVILEQGRLLSGGDIGDLSRHTDPAAHIFVRTLGTDPETLARTLRETPGVRGAEVRPNGAEADVEGGDEAVAALLAALLAKGVRVVEFRPEGTNLENVFMNITKGDVA